MSMSERLAETYARQLVGRVIYHRLADWKRFDPIPFPYQDKQCIDYANAVLDAIGYDDDMILSLEDYLVEKGDDIG